MDDLDIHLDRIRSDTVLIVVKGDFSSFQSVEIAKATAKNILDAFGPAGKPVILIDQNFSIDQLDSEQLKALGLQRIPLVTTHE